MSPDDRLKRYQDAGAEFVDMARAKAEEFLRELGEVSGTTGRQASATFEDWVGGGRRGTDQLLELMRTEIARQFSVLGLATRADLDRLEARLRAGRPAPAKRAPARKTAARKTPAAKKTAAAKKSTARKTTAARKSAAGKTTGAKKTAAKRATAAKKTAARKTTASKTAAKKTARSTSS